METEGGGWGCWSEVSEVRGSQRGRGWQTREKEERENRTEGGLTLSRIISHQGDGGSGGDAATCPAEAHLLKLMEAPRQHTALGNILQPG